MLFDFNLKNFLINENKYYLGEKIGDLLASFQELESNKKGMGTRQIVSNSERIVNQIRKILHSNWSKKESKWLLELQKIGIALSKAIEEKDDLENTLSLCNQVLEELMNKMEVPINNLGTEDQEDKFKSSDDDQVDDKNPNEEKEENITNSKSEVPRNPTPNVKQ